MTSARAASRAVLAALAAFVALTAVSMALYPGGTWTDPRATGHRFWTNFLCDLHHATALNGAPNPTGARVGQAGMLAVVVALAAFWWLAPRLFPAARALGAAVRALGTLAVAAALAVPLTPSDRVPALHGVAVSLAGAAGLAAAALVVAGQARGRRSPRWLVALGALGLTTASVNLALYVAHLRRAAVDVDATAAVQKVAALLALAWVGVTAWRAGRT